MAGVTSLRLTAIRPCRGGWRGMLTCHMQIHAHVRKRSLHSQSLALHFVSSAHPLSLHSPVLFSCLNREGVLHTIGKRQFQEDFSGSS